MRTAAATFVRRLAGPWRPGVEASFLMPEAGRLKAGTLSDLAPKPPTCLRA